MSVSSCQQHHHRLGRMIAVLLALMSALPCRVVGGWPRRPLVSSPSDTISSERRATWLHQLPPASRSSAFVARIVRPSSSSRSSAAELPVWSTATFSDRYRTQQQQQQQQQRRILVATESSAESDIYRPHSQTLLSSSIVHISTTPPPSAGGEGKKLVTLRPIGNNIQEILYNNGLRSHPPSQHPPSDNIIDYNSLDGIDAADVWLQQDGVMVLRGGEQFASRIEKNTQPIDNYQAPYRPPKFPPPGFQPDPDAFSGAPLQGNSIGSEPRRPQDSSWPFSPLRPLPHPLPHHTFYDADAHWTLARSLQRPRRLPVAPVLPHADRSQTGFFRAGAADTAKRPLSAEKPPRGENYFSYRSPLADYTITYSSSSSSRVERR